MKVPQLLTTAPVTEVVDEARGRARRDDAVRPRTGGPAGNAILTAWTGLVILVLGVAELLTLVNVRGLITWHVAIGALLIPPSLLKTASTGWRLVGYYRGQPHYHQAGPPPLLLRLLGPLVVVSTLGLLTTGVLLVLRGEESARQGIVTLPGLRVDWITLHQVFFAVWATVTALHLLGRIVPALRLTMWRGRARRVPGALARRGTVPVVLAAAAVLAVVLVGVDGTWGEGGHPATPTGASSAP